MEPPRHKGMVRWLGIGELTPVSPRLPAGRDRWRHYHAWLAGRVLPLAAEPREIPLRDGHRRPGRAPWLPKMLSSGSGDSSGLGAAPCLCHRDPCLCSSHPPRAPFLPSSRYACVARGRRFTSRSCPWRNPASCRAGTGATAGTTPSTTRCTPAPGWSTSCRGKTWCSRAGRSPRSSPTTTR